MGRVLGRGVREGSPVLKETRGELRVARPFPLSWVVEGPGWLKSSEVVFCSGGVGVFSVDRSVVESMSSFSRVLARL